MASQDRTKWDQVSINKGLLYLNKIVNSRQLSIYHILAMIAAYHCTSISDEATNWKGILSLYDNLIILDQSPIILLNRAIAVSKVYGSKKAIPELIKLEAVTGIKDYHHLHSTLAELYIEQKKYKQAIHSLNNAIRLASLDSEQRLLKSKLEFCKEKLG